MLQKTESLELEELQSFRDRRFDVGINAMPLWNLFVCIILIQLDRLMCLECVFFFVLKYARWMQELQAVSRKFAALCSDNAEKFVQELTRVSELQDQLEYATLLARKERKQLQRADDVTLRSLDVVQQSRRKQVRNIRE